MRYARPILGECADKENMSIEPGPKDGGRSDLDGTDGSYGIAVDGERKCSPYISARLSVGIMASRMWSILFRTTVKNTNVLRICN